MNAEFELCEPFGIDDGELDGISSTNCFVLGVEWQQFRDLIEKFKAGEIDGFEKYCHSVGNLDRIKSMLERHGVPYAVDWANDDWNVIRGGAQAA